MSPQQSPPPNPTAVISTLSAKALTEKIEFIESGTKTLEEFRGKVVLLTLYGRGSGEAAGKLSADLATEFVLERDFVRLNVADLAGAPGFLRGSIRKSVRDSTKKGEEKTRKRFEDLKLTYESSHAPIILLDWKGTLAQELGVKGKTERTYQAFVLGKQGKILFRYSQSAKPPKNDSKDENTVPLLRDEIKKALKK